MLNVGQNILTSDVIYTIKEGLQQNHMLLKFGLQSTNLTCEGAIALAEVIADNCTLQVSISCYVCLYNNHDRLSDQIKY